MASNLSLTFEKILIIAEQSRPGFRAALGLGIDVGLISFTFPDEDYRSSLSDIYGLINGTPREISNQKLMDFIPGYRLLESKEVLAGSEWNGEKITPLLSNYSDDHIAFRGQENALWRLNHDDWNAYKIYDHTLAFAQTTLECFESGAYSLDSDGYLDYDVGKVTAVAARLNPQSDYWK